MAARRPLFRQVSIIGLGLIGGSLGMALRRGKVARRVIGFARREANVRRAVARGAIHNGCTELCPEWLSGSDVVVIALPPSKVPAVAGRVARMVKRPVVITDVASVKGSIVRAAERAVGKRAHFVGAHPMAGSERSGIEAAEAGLFQGAACIVTPTSRTARAARSKVEAMWRRAGCRVQRMSPERHDALVAQVSHAPHLAAVALTLFPDSAAVSLSGGGFADTTRIALGDPALWEEICRSNPREIARALDRLGAELSSLKSLVRRNGGSALRARLQAAQRRRATVRR